MTKKTFLLSILDGVGIAPPSENNAISVANTPVLDDLFSRCPHSELRTDGKFVGLPEGQMGSSEVGHMTIGSGRIIKQSLVQISDDFKSGAFADISYFKDFVTQASEARAIHVIGLLSDGGVHSHGDHALGLCKILNKTGKPVFVHGIADGRDVDRKSGQQYFSDFAAALESLENVHLATVTGRFYAMDRDKRWDRTQKAWDLLTARQGEEFPNVATAFEANYAKDIYDEFVEPTVLPVPEGLDTRLQDGDAVFLFNFRADRMRQLTSCLLEVETEFTPPSLKAIASMTSYDEKFDGKIIVVYPPENYQGTLGEVMVQQGFTQLRIAETEKYPHVTFYLNAGREEPYQDEDRILVPSPKDVKTYDQKPEMSLPEVTDKLVTAIESGTYDFIALNIANGDMVGHCGNFAAAVVAIEHVDKALGRILAAIEKVAGQALIIADHGNAEEMMIDGKPSTSHSTCPVPCIYVGPKDITLKNGGLADVAPTVLTLMDIPVPEEMTGKVLAET